MEFNEISAGQSKEMPAKAVLYGVPKIGKSSLAAQFPNPFFINIEDGLSYLPTKVRATPKLNTYEEVIGWLKHIYENDNFKAGNLVVDSIDWLETLAQAKLIKDHGAKSIVDPAVKDFAYNKGVEMAATLCMTAIKWLDAIWQKKGIRALLIAHSQIREIDLPGKEPYRRNEMKLSKHFAAKVYEWGDLILFADYSFHVSSEGKTSEPKPMLYAGGSAAFLGGGRMKLARELPLVYDKLKEEICK